MPPSIKVLKLVSGEEIIGILFDGKDEEKDSDSFDSEDVAYSRFIFIRNPMKVISEYDVVKKQYAIYLADWFASVQNDTITIEKSNIISYGDPIESLEEHYCELLCIQFEKEDDEETIKLRKYKKILKKHIFNDDDMQ